MAVNLEECPKQTVKDLKKVHNTITYLKIMTYLKTHLCMYLSISISIQYILYNVYIVYIHIIYILCIYYIFIHLIYLNVYKNNFLYL